MSTTDTKDIIANMMKENTGRHMLDSGSAYGRHWEENQDKNLEEQPKIDVEVSNRGTILTNISIYHYLNAHLEFRPEMDEKFRTFVENEMDEYDSWLQCMESFPKYREIHKGKEVGGLFGDGDGFTTNTYNFENCLSQTLQYHYWEEERTPYISLQIHGGCDVRGGYTQPRVFEVYDPEYFMIGQRQLELRCLQDHMWTSDNAGYDFRSCSRNVDKNIEEYPKVSMEEFEEEKLHEQAVVVFDPERDKVYCPECIKNMAQSGEGVDFVGDVELNHWGLLEF